MRISVSVLLAVCAANAAAQVPPQVDPKAAAPAAASVTQSTTPSQHAPAASRNQFFTPVMGIQIEGQGLALPKGVAEEEPIKPAAEPQPATSTFPAAPPANPK